MFDIFNWRESLISSQFFCAVKASDIKVHTSPFDFACASLVLLSPVNSEAVSMSVSQSSSCEESCPFNVGISCNKELSKVETTKLDLLNQYKCLVSRFPSDLMKSTVVDESLSSFKPMYCSREYQASTRLIQQYEKSTLNYPPKMFSFVQCIKFQCIYLTNSQ